MLSTFLALLSLQASVFHALPAPQWMHVTDPPEVRAELLLQQMNLTEKILMLHGCDGPYVGNTAAQARLNIPALSLNDGPQGFRVDSHPGTSTCFPSGINIGATWDVQLAKEWGQAMGQEFRGKGANVQLGPGVNVHRVPLCGRNFEYLSGGDPFLGYTLIQPVVQGIQAAGVIATVKHYVENNQETDRGDVNEIVDDRTRHEIYYPPFEGAVEAGVGALMCSYNKVNGRWSCENSETLGDLKRNRSEGGLGLTDGWVMSDWGGTHSLSIEAGLDQEMPSSSYFGSMLTAAVLNGTIKLAVVDSAVRRVLIPMFSVGLFDTPVNPNHTISSNVTSQEHSDLARTLAASSHVLLKNSNNLLPLNINTPQKIALLGTAAFEPITSGGGSGGVFPAHVVTPYQGLMSALGIPVETPSYACNASAYIKNMSVYQFGCQSYPASSVEECCERCAEYVNCNAFTYDPGNCNLYPTMEPLQPSPGSVTGACKKSRPSPSWNCNKNNVCVAVADGTDLDAVAAMVKEANVAIVAIGTFSGEGRDRYNLSFEPGSPGWARCQLVPPGQDNLVSVVAATGTKTVVAMTAPGAVLTPWRNSVDAILHGLFPGQEYGHGLADVLFGLRNMNPSARLPFTMPNVDNEIGFTPEQFPGVNTNDTGDDDNNLQATYSEQMLVDYRFYTTRHLTPAFPFGHGLSFTSFNYSNLVCSPNFVSAEVLNSGSIAGSDVPQLYLGFPAASSSPPMQLKGFVKTSVLQPGESVTVWFSLRTRDFSVWDTAARRWSLVHGRFLVFVGASVEDVRLSGFIDIAD